MDSPFDFASLSNLQKYIGGIRLNQVPTMRHYISDDGLGFFHQPRDRLEASRSSTATCVSALVQAGLWTERFPLWSSTEKVADKLLETPWESAGLDKNNPFRVAFIAEGVLDLQHAKPGYPGAAEHMQTIKKDAVPILLGRIDAGAVSISPYPESAYLTQLAFRVLQKLDAIDAALAAKVHSWSRREINKEIALISAKSKIADPLNLAYALILATTSASDEKTSPEDKQIFAHALELFFRSQTEDGSWPNSRPLFHYPDVGNAYCFDYELLTQLLLCRPLRANLLPYVPKIAKTAMLLDRISYDLDSLHPNTIVAWPSGHHPQIEGPESWSTASVYHFAHELDGLVAEAIRRAVFKELGTIYSPPVPARDPSKDKFADGFLDATLYPADRPDGVSLREAIAQAFVFPIAREAALVDQGGALGRETPMSAILFGPPGTSKTKLASHIGKFLGWPVLSVDPSYLVQEGLDRIQALANRLFSMLTMAEQIVVLLDEFDEMGRDRARAEELLSRFITTAMLPKLASINDERKIVFLLATNYISGFDAAFSRGGRFDMLVQVMPPNADVKLAHSGWTQLKACYETMSLDRQHDAKPLLEDLTFAEYDALNSKSPKLATPDDVFAAIQEAHKNCTLSQPNEVNAPSADATGERKTLTWKETSTAERSRIRIDLSNVQ